MILDKSHILQKNTIIYTIAAGGMKYGI